MIGNIKHHFETNYPIPLRMIISGTAKLYLICCLRLLLHNKVHAVAPTGVATFNVQDNTLHSFLCLPTQGEFKDQEGQITTIFRRNAVDEISMVSRKMLGKIDRRLWQVFPHHSNEPF